MSSEQAVKNLNATEFVESIRRALKTARSDPKTAKQSYPCPKAGPKYPNMTHIGVAASMVLVYFVFEHLDPQGWLRELQAGS